MANAKKIALAHKRLLEQELGLQGQHTYTPEIAEVIIGKIARGQSIRSIALEPGMPSEWAIFDWLRRFPEFAEAYERVRPARARAIAERATAELESIQDGDKTGAYIADVRIRNQLKLAAIFDPQKYSERHIVQHAGDVAIQLSVNLSRFTEEEKAKEIELQAVEVPMVESDQED